LGKSAREELALLFDQMGYSNNLGVANQAAEKLKQISEVDLRSYYKDHVLDLREGIARHPRSDVFSAGYVTTSPSESMNQMIKRGMPSRGHTLQEAREYFSARIQNHQLVIAGRETARQRYQSASTKFAIIFEFEIEVLHVQLRPKIRELLWEEFATAKEMQSKDNGGTKTEICLRP
jgi:hypothetical protein